MNQSSKMSVSEACPEKWGGLYKIAGISAIVMLIIIPIQIIVFSISPQPDSIKGWFEMFHDNWLLGLMHMDLLYVINNILVAVIYIALYFTLRQKNESLMVIALLLGLLGITAYLASNKAFEMLSLSKLYFNTAVVSEQSMYLSAGQTMLSGWQGTAFDVYYILNGITLLIMGRVMLESRIYAKRTAVIGIICGILMMLPSTAGIIGLVFSLVSLIPWIIFSIQISAKFFMLGKARG